MSKRTGAAPWGVDEELGAVLVAAFVGGLLLAGAFFYKVWNESKMTAAYERQADAQERVADAMERIAPRCSISYTTAAWKSGDGPWQPLHLKTVKPPRPSLLPTLGGTAQDDGESMDDKARRVAEETDAELGVTSFGRHWDARECWLAARVVVLKSGKRRTIPSECAGYMLDADGNLRVGDVLEVMGF